MGCSVRKGKLTKGSRAVQYITDIAGPAVMKKICGELGFTEEQMSVIDSLPPNQFPCYVHADTQARYWRGSNPAMMHSLSKRLTWREYLEFAAPKADLVELLELDLNWLRVKTQNLQASVRSIMGDA